MQKVQKVYKSAESVQKCRKCTKVYKSAESEVLLGDAVALNVILTFLVSCFYAFVGLQPGTLSISQCPGQQPNGRCFGIMTIVKTFTTVVEVRKVRKCEKCTKVRK